MSNSGLLLSQSTSHLTDSLSLASSFSFFSAVGSGASGNGRKEVEEIWNGAVEGRWPWVVRESRDERSDCSEKVRAAQSG